MIGVVPAGCRATSRRSFEVVALPLRAAFRFGTPKGAGMRHWRVNDAADGALEMAICRDEGASATPRRVLCTNPTLTRRKLAANDCCGRCRLRSLAWETTGLRSQGRRTESRFRSDTNPYSARTPRSLPERFDGATDAPLCRHFASGPGRDRTCDLKRFLRAALRAFAKQATP